MSWARNSPTRRHAPVIDLGNGSDPREKLTSILVDDDLGLGAPYGAIISFAGISLDCKVSNANATASRLGLRAGCYLGQLRLAAARLSQASRFAPHARSQPSYSKKVLCLAQGRPVPTGPAEKSEIFPGF